MRRGEVWWADLGLPRGSAPALRRPILVVSADAYNRSEIATVTAVALTANQRLASMPGNVMVPADLGFPDAPSVVNVSQPVTLDRASLEARIGELPDWLMAQVDAGLERALDLGRRR